MSLVTLAKTRAWLGIPSATVQVELDAIIEQCIAGASAMIESYLDRQLIYATYTSRYDGNDRQYLELGQWPVRSVTSVHQSVSWVFDSTTLIDPAQYTFDEQFLDLKIKLTLGSKNVQVVYSAGYTDPNDLTQTYPMHPSLTQAALILTEWLYNQRTDRRIGVSSKSKSNESVNFIDGMPEVVTKILEPFRRDFFIPDTRPIPLR